MGYISFLPTCLIGPPLEYNDYHDFMEKEDVYGKIPSVFRVTG
jgi:D-alanyl-lipoteichoic acid acyltransferase DltB (MBOAT superfamily)